MANYISIISRSDFSDLYKFGHLFIHNLVPFDGELNEHIEDKPLFDAVTKYMNTYEYSTEYLLIHIRRMVFSGSVVEVFIKDVVAVYALDSESQASLSVSLDPRINIQVSCWESYFKELNKKQLIRQANSGKFNCYEIFGISEIDRNKIENLIPRNFLYELFSDLFENKRPCGKKCIWTYLLRYDRHGAFWQDNRGYFSDAVNVFENFLHEKEMSYEWDDELKFADIIENNGTLFTEISKKLTSNVTPEYTIAGCNYFAVAPLFLYMKAYFGDKGITTSSFSQNEYLAKGQLYKNFGFDFAVAVALLGIKFGHDLTYGCYYEIKKLGIYNTTVSTRKTGITDPSTGRDLSFKEVQTLLDELSFNNEELKEKIAALQKMVVQTDNNDLTKLEQGSEYGGESASTEKEGPSSEQMNSTEKVGSLASEDANVKSEEGEEPILTKEKLDLVESAHAENAECKNDAIVSQNDKDVESGTILPSKIGMEESPEAYFEPIEMRKLNGSKTDFSSAKQYKSSVWARSKEDYEDKLKKNYRPIDYFDKLNKGTLFDINS